MGRWKYRSYREYRTLEAAGARQSESVSQKLRNTITREFSRQLEKGPRDTQSVLRILRRIYKNARTFRKHVEWPPWVN